jgi:hypothetical protein
LFEHHTEMWLIDCDRFRIKIKAREALDFIQEFHGEAGVDDPNVRIPYSNGAFVDAIVEFIIGDDQASVSIIWSYLG